MAAGTQLPSEDGLVERFKVSRTTVRKAIQNLIERLTELTGFVEDTGRVCSGRRYR